MIVLVRIGIIAVLQYFICIVYIPYTGQVWLCEYDEDYNFFYVIDQYDDNGEKEWKVYYIKYLYVYNKIIKRNQVFFYE